MEKKSFPRRGKSLDAHARVYDRAIKKPDIKIAKPIPKPGPYKIIEKADDTTMVKFNNKSKVTAHMPGMGKVIGSID